MTKYRVRYEIDLTVEADTPEYAIQKAICSVGGVGYYLENEITKQIERDAEVEILEDTDF